MDVAMAALGLFMMVVGLLGLLGSFGALMYYIYKRGQANPARDLAAPTSLRRIHAKPRSGDKQR